MREYGGGCLGTGLFDDISGEGAVRVATHELLTLVVPTHGPQGLGGLIPGGEERAEEMSLETSILHWKL